MYLNHDKRDVVFELEVSVASKGYRLVEGRRQGIFVKDRNPFLQVKPGSEFVIKRIRLTRSIWRDLVVIDNLKRVARPDKINRALLGFCENYGLSEFGVGGVVEEQLAIPTTFLLNEARLISKAIKSATRGVIEFPPHLVDAINSRTVFEISEISTDTFIVFRDPILAAWFDLRTRNIDLKPPCGFCGGLNIARGDARFCSSHCSNRWHKAKARGQIK